MVANFTRRHPPGITHPGQVNPIIIGFCQLLGLLAFEAFNFASTQYALDDVLGNLSFLVIHWSTILAVAFCSIDFAGILRLFSQNGDNFEARQSGWYLFIAWLLATGMNAVLTWWAISEVFAQQTIQTGIIAVFGEMVKKLPILVAVAIWFLRILIIGAFSNSISRRINLNEQSESDPWISITEQTYQNRLPRTCPPAPRKTRSSKSAIADTRE